MAALFRGAVHVGITLVLVLVPALAVRAEPTRTWEFDVRTPGTYKLQIEHRVPNAMPRANVIYTISIGEETQTRELALIANRPFSPLIVDVPTPRQMRVVVTGLNQAVLNDTRIYVYDELSLPPLEVFDPTKHAFDELNRIRAFLEQPEEQIDLARTMLTIDKMINPSVDVEANLEEIDAMVKHIAALPDFGVLTISHLLALKRYVYEAGEWNGHRTYEYDLDDPLGSNIKHKLLSSYLASKKGNCVTMPLFFIILGQRLGLDLTLSTAPAHLFVKFRNDTGAWINLEATSGANPARDVWIRGQHPMTDEALANGVYLQPLTRKETAAVMAMVLAEYYLQLEEYRKANAIAHLVLEYYPKNVGAMVLKGSAYARIANNEFRKKYRAPDHIPPYLRSYFWNLGKNNLLSFEKAKALGWREETKEEREAYLRAIGDARKQRKSN